MEIQAENGEAEIRTGVERCGDKEKRESCGPCTQGGCALSKDYFTCMNRNEPTCIIRHTSLKY
jgi:hypothetical protein